MRKIIFNIIYVSLIAISLSCIEKDKETMDIAGHNRIEFIKVMNNYSDHDEISVLKHKAAIYLVKNITEHGSLYSVGIDSFVTKVHKTDTIIGTEQLKNMWKKFKKYDKKQKIVLDAQALSADYIIDNIDTAFDIWQNAKWHDEIDFKMFCYYILPYRISNEPLPSLGWRDSINHKYRYLIENKSNMLEAYSQVYLFFKRRIKERSFDYPYLMNVLDMEHLNKGNCFQRCVYIATIMRALGFPVVVETIDHWANYSTTGHSWIALVTKNGIYTVAENDTVAKRFNSIDASSFPIVKTDRNFPYELILKKRCAKIWRITFEKIPIEYNDKDVDKTVYERFRNPYLKDVSNGYCLTKGISIRNNWGKEYCYLCIYETGNDWSPVIWAKNEDGKFNFNNIGDSIVYLPVIFEKEKMIPIDAPFILYKDSLRRLDGGQLRTVEINRKYPLIGSHVKNWIELRNGCFEASNDPEFKDKHTLYVINNVPIFRNEFFFKEKAYQYVRYVSPCTNRCPLTEIEFWNGNRRIYGVPFAEKLIDAEKCFDGNTFTTMKKQKIGYIVGMDFKQKQILNRIVFYPKNDDNFILPGESYELFYYDHGWKSLGIQKSKGYSLVYKNVPDNVLLILKNVNKGIEERIFTYVGNKQIWW